MKAARHGVVGIVLAVIALGCAENRKNERVGAVPRAPSSPATARRVTERPANPDGDVLIVEYHRISPKEARWDRSRERFRADLDRLYRMGFRPVTVTQYLTGKMPLAPGASPVVFTFDDSNPTQFALKSDGSVDPNCGIGIWKSFWEKHPDFPIHATFYVLPKTMWGQHGLARRKVEMLRAWGSELGNHTITHPKLSSLADDRAKAEIGGAIDALESLGERSPMTIALPFGISPRNPALLRGFDWNGKRYTLRGALLVGAGPAPSPSSPKLNPYRIPRIQGIEGLDGISFWLDKVRKGQVRPYVAP